MKLSSRECYRTRNVNIGSGNGLVPARSKSLPEPMLTQIPVPTLFYRYGQSRINLMGLSIIIFMQCESQMQFTMWVYNTAVCLLGQNSRFNPIGISVHDKPRIYLSYVAVCPSIRLSVHSSIHPPIYQPTAS